MSTRWPPHGQSGARNSNTILKYQFSVSRPPRRIQPTPHTFSTRWRRHPPTAPIACVILANNRWDGWLAEEREGERLDPPEDGILQRQNYYFCVSTDAHDTQSFLALTTGGFLMATCQILSNVSKFQTSLQIALSLARAAQSRPSSLEISPAGLQILSENDVV